MKKKVTKKPVKKIDLKKLLKSEFMRESLEETICNIKPDDVPFKSKSNYPHG